MWGRLGDVTAPRADSRCPRGRTRCWTEPDVPSCAGLMLWGPGQNPDAQQAKRRPLRARGAPRRLRRVSCVCRFFSGTCTLRKLHLALLYKRMRPRAHWTLRSRREGSGGGDGGRTSPAGVLGPPTSAPHPPAVLSAATRCGFQAAPRPAACRHHGLGAELHASMHL